MGELRQQTWQYKSCTNQFKETVKWGNKIYLLCECQKSQQSNIPFLKLCRFVILDTWVMARRSMHIPKIKII